MKCKQAADIIKKIVLFQIVRLYHDYSYASQYILIRHVSNKNRISIDVELEKKNYSVTSLRGTLYEQKKITSKNHTHPTL